MSSWLGAIGGAVVDYGGAALDAVGGAYDWLAPSYLGGAGGWLDSVGAAGGVTDWGGGIDQLFGGGSVIEEVAIPAGVELGSIADLEGFVNAGWFNNTVGNAFGADPGFWSNVVSEIGGLNTGKNTGESGLGDLLSDIGAGLSQAGSAYGSNGPTRSIAPSFGFPGYRGTTNPVASPGIDAQTAQNLLLLRLAAAGSGGGSF